MTENYAKSKLKRKKSCVEKRHPEISSTDTVRRGHVAVPSSGCPAETEGSVVPAAAWWNREQLSAVENLWAFTLKSALPHMENQLWDLVPDLPHPSTERSTALTFDELQWCDLREDVAPFPEPAPPSPGALLSQNPTRLSSSQQDLSVQTKPVPHTSNRQLSSHNNRQSHDGKTASPQALNKKEWPSPHGWAEAASPAGCSVIIGEEGRKGGEQEEEAGPVNRRLLMNQVNVSDIQVSMQKQGENKQESMKDKEEKEVHGSVRGDEEGRGGLQSCPMCLLVFPFGFTQMDCDGHLAQCLSELNVDMTW